MHAYSTPVTVRRPSEKLVAIVGAAAVVVATYAGVIAFWVSQQPSGAPAIPHAAPAATRMAPGMKMPGMQMSR